MKTIFASYQIISTFSEVENLNKQRNANYFEVFDFSNAKLFHIPKQLNTKHFLRIFGPPPEIID